MSVELDDRDAAAVEAQFVSGDEHGLKAAYDGYGAMVFSFCRRRLGYDAAAEATQDVFVSAWKSRQRFDPAKGSLAGWLTGIARFKVIDSLRASGRLPDPTDEDLLDRVVNTASEDPEIGRIAEQMLVAEALDSLSARARKSVELAFFSQMTHQEIAEATGVPLGTVKSDIRRALQQMQRDLEGFDEPAPY